MDSLRLFQGIKFINEVGGGCRGAAVLPASALSGDDRQLGSGVWPGLVTVDDLRGTGSHLPLSPWRWCATFYLHTRNDSNITFLNLRLYPVGTQIWDNLVWLGLGKNRPF